MQGDAVGAWRKVFHTRSDDTVPRRLRQNVWRPVCGRRVRELQQLDTRQRACHARVQLGVPRRLLLVQRVSCAAQDRRQVLLRQRTHLLREGQPTAAASRAARYAAATSSGAAHAAGESGWRRDAHASAGSHHFAAYHRHQEGQQRRQTIQEHNGQGGRCCYSCPTTATGFAAATNDATAAATESPHAATTPATTATSTYPATTTAATATTSSAATALIPRSRTNATAATADHINEIRLSQVI